MTDSLRRLVHELARLDDGDDGPVVVADGFSCPAPISQESS